MTKRQPRWLWLALLLALVATPARAQLEDNLSSFTDETAEGYLRPLSEAFGQNLNSGFFTSAHVPRAGLRVRLEVHAMGVWFSDDDNTFFATPGGDFQGSGDDPVEVPTVVGSETGVTVSGEGGTEYVFPGGFDVGSFALAVPQLTVGSIMGTEAMVRWIAVDTGDSDWGDISLFGFGARHSLSQYFLIGAFDLAVGAYYQKLTVGGGDLLDATAFSVGLQGSRSFGIVEPFASLSLDTFSMTAEYTSTSGSEEETIQVDLERQTSPHLVLGLGFHFGIVHLNVAGNFADRVGLSAGLAVGL